MMRFTAKFSRSSVPATISPVASIALSVAVTMAAATTVAATPAPGPPASPGSSSDVTELVHTTVLDDAPTVPLALPGTQPTSLTAQAAAAPRGGLSGFDRYAPVSARIDQAFSSALAHYGPGTVYLAISDDRNTKGPVRAYPMYVTRTPLGIDGPVVFGEPLAFSAADQTPFTSGSVDPESIRTRFGGADYLWTSEGDADKGIAPAIYIANNSGRNTSTLSLPEYHIPQPGKRVGVANNRAYEGLTLARNDTLAVVLTEGPLQQDSRNRLTVYDLATTKPVNEYAYATDTPTQGTDFRGATEILAADASAGPRETAFLVLERDYVPGVGTHGALYRVTLDEATDILGRAALDGSETPVTKEKILDLPPTLDPDTGALGPDNIEGLAWGPTLADGRRTVRILTDDNFSGAQHTLLHQVALSAAAYRP